MELRKENCKIGYFFEENGIGQNINTSSLGGYRSAVNKQSLRRILAAFLREQILEYHYQIEKLILIFQLPRLGSCICVSQAKLNSLQCFTEFEKVFFVDRKKNVRKLVTDPLDLLEIVKKELDTIFDPQQWKKVSSEVSNHIQNAVLVAWKKDRLKTEQFNIYATNKAGKFSDFLKKNETLSDCSFKFEQLSFTGHPYHPFAKTKVGFSIEDILRYTTEFRPKVSILLAAVHKSAVIIETTQSKFTFSVWFSQHYPNAWHLWSSALNSKKINSKDYIPFPVHPWQADNIVRNVFSDQISANQIILFDNVSIEASPTSSFRTLVSIENFRAPYIKLPIGIYASGVYRTFSVNSIKNMPKITRIFRKILSTESSIAERLTILPEVYGLRLKDIEDDKAKNFTAIFRENVTNYLAHGEIAIVVSALFERLSANNTSIFTELMGLAGLFDYKDTLAYFSRYVDLVLGSHLDLYLIYGIALEGHQQNTLAVFQNGYIKRFIARDFDGISILADSLSEHDFAVEFPLHYPAVTKNKIAVRNQLLHTVYQLHLGELVLLLSAHFNCKEQAFWAIIREKTEERFLALKARLNPMRLEDEYNAILKTDWPVKALFRMRLEEQYVCDGIFSSIPNPLAL